MMIVKVIFKGVTMMMMVFLNARSRDRDPLLGSECSRTGIWVIIGGRGYWGGF